MSANDFYLIRQLLQKPFSYNADVKAYFGLNAETDSQGDRKTSARAAIMQSCLIDTSDTINIVLLKLMFFFFVVQNRFGDNDSIFARYQIYGIPYMEYQETYRKFQPQVLLYFEQEKKYMRAIDKYPLAGRISFRLMNSKYLTLSQSELTELALNIKQAFPLNYQWEKGKIMYSYTDWEKGYQLQLLCNSETAARELIGKVLNIQSDTPDWKNFNTIRNDTPSIKYPDITTYTNTPIGKKTNHPKRREGKVSFRYAILNIHGIAPIALYDPYFNYQNRIL